MPNNTILYLGSNNQLIEPFLEKHEVVIVPKILNEKIVLKKYFKKDGEIQSEIVDDKSILSDSRLIIEDKEFVQMRSVNQIIDAIVNEESLLPYSKDEIFSEIEKIISDYEMSMDATKTEKKAELRELIIQKLGYRRILGDKAFEVLAMYSEQNQKNSRNVIFIKGIGGKGSTKPEEVNKANSNREFREEILKNMGFGMYQPTIEYSDPETAADKVETGIKLNEELEKANSGSENIKVAKILFLMLKSFYDLDRNNATIKHSLRVGFIFYEILKELEDNEKLRMPKKHYIYLILAAIAHDSGKLINLDENGKNTFSSELQIHAGDRNKLDQTADAPIDKHASIGESNVYWIREHTGENSILLNYLRITTSDHHKNVEHASLAGQIVCVADIFDALISKRNYGRNADKSDRTVEQAMGILVANTKGYMTVKVAGEEISLGQALSGKWNLLDAQIVAKENWENDYRNNVLYKKLLIVNPELAGKLKDRLTNGKEQTSELRNLVETELSPEEDKLLRYLEITEEPQLLEEVLDDNNAPEEVRNKAQDNVRILKYIEQIKNDRSISGEFKLQRLMEVMRENNESESFQSRASAIFQSYGKSIEETIPKVNPDILEVFAKIIQREFEKSKKSKFGWLKFDKKNPHVVSSVYGIDFTTETKKRKIDKSVITSAVKAQIKNLLDIDSKKVNIREVVKQLVGPVSEFIKEFLNKSIERAPLKTESPER